MTDFKRTVEGTLSKFVSVIVPIADSILLGLDSGYALDSDRPHCMLGVELFSDEVGTPAEATAGTFGVMVHTIVNPQSPDMISEPTIDATALTTADWSANTRAVEVVPATLAGVTHWRVNLAMNGRAL